MSIRNRYSSLTVDELLPPLPPSPTGHRVIEFDDTRVTPVEELRTPSPAAVAVPSSKQEEQGSVHEVSIASLVFQSLVTHCCFILAG